jgi:hypothetical protein
MNPHLCRLPEGEEENEKLMKRKITVFALSAMLFALCGSVDAQQPGKVLCIGFLDNSTAAGMAILIDAFRQELSKLAWVEGKNFTMEYLRERNLLICQYSRQRSLNSSLTSRRRNKLD